MSFRIIPRTEWGARYADGAGAAPLPSSAVYLHHSVTIAPNLVQPFDDDFAAVRTLERIGQERFGAGISYTFVVTPVGLIFQGHSIGRKGTHTGGRNSTARAICLVGNYENAQPTNAQLDACAWILRTGHQKGWFDAPKLDGGHRDVATNGTSCPGRNAYAKIAEINRRALLTQDGFLMDDKTLHGLVTLTYRACLGRNPESLAVFANGAQRIKEHGLAVYVAEVANSPEGKAFAAKLKKLPA